MSMSPVIETSTAATRITQAPSFADARKTSTCFSRVIFQALMPARNAPDTRNDAAIVWKNAIHAVFWNSTAKMSLRTARPVSGSMS